MPLIPTASGHFAHRTSQRTYQATADAPRSAATTRFYAHAAFISCICLQRFGIHVGTASLSLSVPVLFAIALSMLVFGHGRISAKVALSFAAFAFWTVLAAVGATLWPDSRVGFSIMSLAEVLLIYATLVIRPSDFDSAVVQRIFVFYVRLCAVLGILEFALQFVGIRLFTFSQIIPRLTPFLLESDFATESLQTYGSEFRRSNGFFLVEASYFSQILAIGIIIDYLVLGRKKYLPLYLVAYMTSYSGTGLLALAAGMGVYGLTSGQGLSRVLMLGTVGLLVLGLFVVILPDQSSAFLGRFSGFGTTDASGQARFLGQIDELREFGGDARALLGYGPGATTRTAYWTPGSGNPALQLFIDYGFVGLILFYGFLVSAIWSSRYVVLSVVLLITFQLGGGNLLFVPFTLFLITLGIWATEENSNDRPNHLLDAVGVPSA